VRQFITSGSADEAVPDKSIFKASGLFLPIEESLCSACPEMSFLTTEQAYTFLRETSHLLQDTGFGVVVPR